ncbi:protein BPS1, chloroplastic-like [Impatiens glandulifera]|uniref:protein BPS1, chloroplastic-like n=1 Tax=Impatiens glandulifera TaxID=253017 RepID=UPI001FB0C2B3|nr:protein BPS1, chloroplastic-like [Impatiens glandulifera]XP_047319872.1 protein BPS1, chloroplastic-like [Impatiens glandulifera]
MSRPQNPQRPSFPFGNPFKLILPNSSSVSPRHATLLTNFELSLAERLEKLNPKNGEDVLALSWMVSAIVSVCETHAYIKTFISDLELSVYDWDAKWIDLYLDDSLKLLDICISFSSELAHFSQGHLLLQCIMHNMEANPTKASEQANSFINDWNRHISSRNPRLEVCSSIIDDLTATTNLPKIKNSSKGKVLVKAMYGVKVHTLFVLGIFLAAFSGSAKLTSFQVPDICIWSHAFENLQNRLQKEVKDRSSKGGRFSLVKELNSVDTIVGKLHPIVQDESGSAKMQAFGDDTCDLKDRAEKLSLGLDSLTKGVEGFFQILLSGRDALLSKFRTALKVEDPMQKRIGVR